MNEQTKAQQTTNQQENKMNKQTKAQRLADAMEGADEDYPDDLEVAAELRRLDALNAELVEALERLARLGNGNQYGNSIGNDIAKAALAKAKEQT